MKAALSGAVCFSMFVAARAVPAADLSATGLRCEYAENPLGVDVPAPRLFWKLQSQTRGQQQSAWQILAASSADLLGHDKANLWDSGKVRSGETIHIPYAGKPLASSQQVFWKVRAWDKDGKVSAWSPTASWTMGLLKESDWQADWVGAAETNASARPQTVLLRREFTVKPKLRRALLHVCGLGCYEVSLNGRKAGDALFPPGWTKYDKTCLYDAYDVTALLRPGRNAAGLLLGNGMYNVVGGRYKKFTGSFGPLKAIAQLRLEYADGSTELIGSDANWRLAPGPITFSCVYGGEDYDARLEPAGWNQPNFDDSKWDVASVLKGPGGKLKGLSCAAPPIEAFDVLKPVSVKPLKPGVTVFDLGQNAALMPRLKVHGTAGSVVKMIPAELLGDDGAVTGLGAYWKYTLSDGGSQSWFPKFFYYGCRYIQIECQAPTNSDLPVVETLEGVVVHSTSTPVGEFECSNPLFNRIRTLVRWAQRSNMMSVMTDCPHREKLGWLEEDHLNGPSLRYEFDLAQLFAKVMNDMADSQRPNGLVPDIAPEYVQFNGGFVDSPEWGSAFILVPWQQYEFTGDLELLRRHYDGLKRYVAYLGSRATNHIVSHGLGDWYDIGPKPPGVAQLTPIALTATAFYYYDAAILARTAALLGQANDAKQYGELAGQIRTAFNQKFFRADKGQYDNGSQTSCVLPLAFGLVPDGERERVFNHLVKKITDETHDHIGTGLIGGQWLMRVLTAGGRADLAYTIAAQKTYPSWGYMVEKGATTIWELWNGDTADPAMNSGNHVMLVGDLGIWLYENLAGIKSDPEQPGFKHIVMRPEPVGDLQFVKASHRSPYGLIASDWQKKDGVFRWNVTVPANTTATVYVPAKNAESVTEDGKLAAQAKGVKLVKMENGRAVFSVGAGNYRFESR